MVVLPDNAENGKQTMEYEVPWFVPESIHFLDELLTKDMSVLEFGSGGSTIFFSRRVKSVVSYENFPVWYSNMLFALRSKGITNVDMQFYKGREAYPTGEFNCILIDPYGPEWGWLLQRTIPLLTGPKIFIIDNYSHHPFDAMDMKVFDQQYGEDYVIKTWDHPEWSGSGTRIYMSKNGIEQITTRSLV